MRLSRAIALCARVSWMAWSVTALVLPGYDQPCTARVGVVAPLWQRPPTARPVEAQIAHGSIAGGINMALRGFEAALLLNTRPSFPIMVDNITCPTSTEWDPAEAVAAQLGSRGQMNLWFLCVFSPIAPCPPTRVITHPEAFGLSHRLSREGDALRRVCRQVSVSTATCNRLQLRKAVANHTLHLLPHVRAAIDAVKLNFTSTARLQRDTGQSYAAFQIRRGDKCRGSIREAGCTSASVFVQRLKQTLGKRPPPNAVLVMSDDWRTVKETQLALDKSLPGPRVVSLAGPNRKGRGVARLCREGVERRPELCGSDALKDDPMAGRGGLSSLGTFVEFWAEMELVAEADYVVVGHSSNVGRLVEVLRTREPMAVSVDVDWHPN
eukprot:m.86731 g.86731  ORF g.86731 m.86731 type:complete len:381 (-) comp9675_c0_seq1:1412-2554(-)